MSFGLLWFTESCCFSWLIEKRGNKVQWNGIKSATLWNYWPGTIFFFQVLKYAECLTAAKLVAQWADWDQIRRPLICKSNEVPEIESYGAHVQVNRAASVPLPDEVRREEIEVVCCLPQQTLPPAVYFLCAGSTLADRLSFKTDDGQHAAPVRTSSL